MVIIDVNLEELWLVTDSPAWAQPYHLITLATSQVSPSGTLPTFDSHLVYILGSLPTKIYHNKSVMLVSLGNLIYSTVVAFLSPSAPVSIINYIALKIIAT